MADIKEALELTLGHEGGYVFDKDDPGGETYKGVARNSNPNWLGWKVIDSMKGKRNFPTCLDERNDLHENVISLYKNNYWDAVKGDFIESQIIANKVLDVAINMGAGTASKLLQMTLDVAMDGNVGTKTLAAVNSVNEESFMIEFRLVLIARYMTICKSRYSSRKYLYGWIKRVLS